MSDLVKGIVDAIDNDDWFVGVNNDRLKDVTSSSSIEGNYAAIALAYKGSSGNTEFRGDPQAPWCYRINTKDSTFSTITPSGFEEKPEDKPNLLSIYDKNSNPTALTAFVGYPVYLEISVGLTPYDNEAKSFDNICQIAGYRIKKDGPRVNSLPSVPFTTMYSWDSVRNRTFNEPSDEVVSLDPIGTRGKSCVQCIKDGESVSKYNGKTERCSVRGYLYVVATHIYNKRKGLTPISEYTDEHGNSLESTIFCITLRRSSLYGSYNKKTHTYDIVGPQQYIRQLKENKNYRDNNDASKHLSLFENVPNKMGIGSFHQLHITDVFESSDDKLKKAFTREEESKGAEKARDLWVKLRPEINLQTIQEPNEETFNPSLNVEIASAPSVEDDNNEEFGVEDWTQFKV